MKSGFDQIILLKNKIKKGTKNEVKDRSITFRNPNSSLKQVGKKISFEMIRSRGFSTKLIFHLL